MTTIRATCDNCGDIVVGPSDVVMLWIVDLDRWSYQLTCACGLVRYRQIESRLVRLFDSAGCQMTSMVLPAEMFELHDGPPLSDDDLANFRIALGLADDGDGAAS